MIRNSVLSLVICSSLSFACGGQAERTVGEESEDEGPGTASGSSGGKASPSDDLELGPCVKGFDRFERLDQPCNWLAENLCYDSKEAACSCICPRPGPSLCLSGFYGGEGSATAVYCD
jgi:hypothetical protein